MANSDTKYTEEELHLVISGIYEFMVNLNLALKVIMEQILIIRQILSNNNSQQMS